MKVVERLCGLVEATRTFGEPVADPQLLRTIAEQTGRLLDGRCLLVLISDDRSQWRLAAEYSPDTDHARDLGHTLKVRERTTSTPPSPVPFAAQPWMRLPTDLAGEIDPSSRAIINEYERRGAVWVAMRSKEDVLGTLAVVRTTKDALALEASDVELLQVLADHAGQMILHARSLEVIQHELAEHRRARELLSRSQEKRCQVAKMEAVGRLAGGVAHDFNNILATIVGFSHSVLDALGDESPLRVDVEEICRAGERAAILTRQLLAFGRKQVLAPCAVDLNQIVSDMKPTLCRLLGEGVELHLALLPGLARCLVDPGQAEQLLMNLVVNARDAMPAGGELTIETANVELDEEYVHSHPDAKVGPHAVLSVTDTGIGMDSATLARSFEPFFTTKPKGTATGLGLATVHGIVHQSDGNIWVYSEPGKGTTFRIQLPVTEAAEPVRQTRPPASSAGVQHGSETVLVVDDNAQVRKLVRSILERAGYPVLEAGDGEEAEVVTERQGQPVQLLLTDVVLPGLSGRLVAERIAERYPELRVLYMSGYADHAIVNDGVLEPGIHLIPKPFTPKALLERVREVLAIAAPRVFAVKT